jgi:hypothetical protein
MGLNLNNFMPELDLPKFTDKIHIHLNAIYHSFFNQPYQYPTLSPDHNKAIQKTEDWRHAFQFAYQFRQSKTTSHDWGLSLLCGIPGSFSIHVQGHDYRYTCLAEVWLWYHYYIAHIRSWEHNQPNGFRNEAYWSRIPSHYRSLKHADEKANKLKKILMEVFNQNPTNFIRYQDWMSHSCGFKICKHRLT